MVKMKSNKRGQEEMVGFALIIIIVSVVILFLLAFSLKSKDKENVESYELSSFLQSTLQYTTSCQVNGKNLSVQNLIFECADGASCDGFEGTLGESSCDRLNSDLSGILNGSWPAGPENPVKGYNFTISANEVELVSLAKGNVTSNYKGTVQSLARGSDSLRIMFKTYY